jgi:hypothetical protein
MMRDVGRRLMLGSISFSALLSFSLPSASAQTDNSAPAPASDTTVTTVPPVVVPAADSGTGAATENSVYPRRAQDRERADRDENENASERENEEDHGDWDLRHRRYASWTGPTGGLFVTDPRAAQPGAVRVQLGLDAFSGKNVLATGDHVEVSNQTLALSVTALERLEFFANLANRSSTQSKPAPTLSLDALGDVTLGGRIGAPLGKLVDVGGELRGVFVNKAGGGGYDWGSTSLGLRASLSIDLERLPKPVPFLARFNIGYVFDNTSHLIKATEDSRYSALTNPQSKSDETSHLISRFERLAMNIDRVDHLAFGAGLEAPLRIAEQFYLHPLVEWQLGVPVNRQNYDCPFMSRATNVGKRSSPNQEDSCYERSPGALPMDLAFGVRVVPPARGLSALVAFDVGLSGTNTFVRELPAVLPWRFMIAFSYDYDARPAPVQLVSAPAAAPLPLMAAGAPRGRVQGSVSTPDGKPIADARVHFLDRQLTTLASGDDGSFTTEPLPPGPVPFEVTHPDYLTARCSAVIADVGGDVALRCALAPKPLVGKVKGQLLDNVGGGVANGRVILTGPSNALVLSDPHGAYASDDLIPGAYSLRIEAPGYFIKQAKLQVDGHAATSFNVSLTRKPVGPSVIFSGDTIETPALGYASETTSEPSAASEESIAEIADLLLMRTDLYLQVQGFANDDAVSMARALAIKRRLVDAGVPESHIEAVGGGKKRTRFLVHR